MTVGIILVVPKYWCALIIVFRLSLSGELLNNLPPPPLT